VFGLGNKQYEHFNAVGKRMEKAMGALGAKQIVRRGDGDDDACIDDDFDAWCAELYAAVENSGLLGGAGGGGAAAEGAAPAEYQAEILEGAARGGVELCFNEALCGFALRLLVAGWVRVAACLCL
jgi:NADPH-ferrihemoprotein reductase